MHCASVLMHVWAAWDVLVPSSTEVELVILSVTSSSHTSSSFRQYVEEGSLQTLDSIAGLARWHDFQKATERMIVMSKLEKKQIDRHQAAKPRSLKLSKCISDCQFNVSGFQTSCPGSAVLRIRKLYQICTTKAEIQVHADHARSTHRRCEHCGRPVLWLHNVAGKAMAAALQFVLVPAYGLHLTSTCASLLQQQVHACARP